jgi:phosphatidylserine synthase
MGLPIPAAAATICSFILFHEFVLSDIAIHFILLIIMSLVSYLMISRIPYIAVNKTTRGRKQTGLIIVTVISIGLLAIFHTIWVYLACAWLYIAFGLYNKAKILLKNQRKPIFVRRRLKK